jgi:large subunit ribosomal protein L34e
MVSGKQKSRSKRRIYRRTPGGRVVIHYVKRRPSRAVCGNCRTLLAGVPAVRGTEMRRIPKSSKRPERMFGGTLCSPCSKRVIISRSRSQA